ncbi:TIGR01841 family phasin [Lacisediminimonas sp.]|uniref:TIGR01841 family phasin n=1 Tax=Lacisediminimonas sp. TaxID=3060582 RepID=UPI002726A65A|nr:TIGR01841 family phasin [Lacisediminimonas sp.]MDO8299920.1 TIGR01841 family phasin [Lacisediminimonas sp.]
MFAEQFSSAAKANFESQVAAANAFNNKAFEGIAQLFDLNLRAARAALAESTATAHQMLAAKDPRELVTLLAAQSQPAAEKTVAYSRQVAGIAAATQAELAKAAEEQTATRTREVAGLVDDLLKNAPPGMEQAVAMLKTTMANSGAGYEQINKFAKQANETFEENFSKLFAQFGATVEKTAARARK